jgi:hypothetical protein
MTWTTSVGFSSDEEHGIRVLARVGYIARKIVERWWVERGTGGRKLAYGEGRECLWMRSWRFLVIVSMGGWVL